MNTQAKSKSIMERTPNRPLRSALLLMALFLGAMLPHQPAQAQIVEFFQQLFSPGFQFEDEEPEERSPRDRNRRRRIERQREQLPWDTPALRERDRSEEQVQCGRLNEFLSYEKVTVDGVRMTRPVLKKEAYVRCMKQPNARWVVKHAQWSPEHEQKFQEFIVRLGESDCKTVDTCMVSAKANPMISQEDLDAFHYSDCADFPMYLRAYFAYKYNLPFSYLSGIGVRTGEQAPKPQLDERGQPKPLDYRYTSTGNLPHARISVFGGGRGQCASNNFFLWTNCMVERYHTGMARMSKWEPGPSQPQAPDYYSPRIDRNSIKPGTVVYDSAGHIAIVYKIDDSGEISLLQASPGGFVSRTKMTRTYVMVGPKSGSGFKNWRPFKVVNPRYNKNGEIIQGHFLFAKDEEIDDFSMEQYFGHKDIDQVYNNGKYTGSNVRYQERGIEFEKLEFMRFVRARLMRPDLRLNPVKEFEKSLRLICSEFQNRAEAVSKAIKDGISSKNPPEKYPSNIFGASGEWENYSTPGRDARIRQMIYFLKNDLQWYSSITEAANRQSSRFVDYRGADLKADLTRAFHRANYACRVRYKTSTGEEVDLTLKNLLDRAAKISFDPYQCIENRWGATGQVERASCTNSSTKRRWHTATQFLRNIYARPDQLSTNRTLAEMEQWVSGKSVVSIGGRETLPAHDTSSDYDLLKAIAELEGAR